MENQRRPDAGLVMLTEGPRFLLAILRCCRLTLREQRILAVILGADSPMTTRAVAKRARFAYSHGKTIVRGLVAWGLLERTSEGLRFQPDPARWGPPKEVTEQETRQRPR